MLRHLRIENFKAWKDTGDIELAPISVFLGTNSSGKSSIFQFLMMLKQTMQDPDPNTVLNTGDDKTIVDVGQPDYMLYNHDTSHPLCFSYDWDVNTPFHARLDSKFPDELLRTLSKTEDGTAYQWGTNLHFMCFLSVRKSGRPFKVERFLYNISHSSLFSDFIIEMRENTEPQFFQRDEPEYEVYVQQIQLDVANPYTLISPLQFYGFSDNTISKYKNGSLLRILNRIHPEFFSNMFYLGPLRDRASRLYAWKGNNPSDVGIDGSKAIFAMLSARLDFRKFELPNRANNYEIDVVVAEMLKKAGLIEQFRVRRIAQGRQEYEVQVQIKGSHVWADLPDVGCGVSQVLPVLVELFYAPPGSIILIEQPELHLHPSAQAALADVMIDAVQAKENGKPRNIQLLIETHSEHFLRRLQRRVAEGVIDESMVRGYFADTDTDPFQLRKLEIDAYGNILNWPEDFFGDMAGDIFGQAEAAFRRKKDEYEQNAENH